VFLGDACSEKFRGCRLACIEPQVIFTLMYILVAAGFS
jgi:hypothetical protein